MAYQFPPDIESVIRDRMATGGYGSEDEVLRDALAALTERADDRAALRAGLEDMKAGRTKPVAAVDAEIRKELGFSPRK